MERPGELPNLNVASGPSWAHFLLWTRREVIRDGRLVIVLTGFDPVEFGRAIVGPFVAAKAGRILIQILGPVGHGAFQACGSGIAPVLVRSRGAGKGNGNNGHSDCDGE